MDNNYKNIIFSFSKIKNINKKCVILKLKLFCLIMSIKTEYVLKWLLGIYFENNKVIASFVFEQFRQFGQQFGTITF